MPNSYAENLKQFEEVKVLPTALHKCCKKYKTSSLLSTTFINKKAAFHKLCMSLFNKQKLERKHKLVESICSEKDESEQGDVIDPDAVLERMTRQSGN